MADFEDITGWREELAAFEKTEEGQAFFAGNKRYRGRKLPYENAVQIVELIFANEELHEALRKGLWFADYVEEHDLDTHDDEYLELNPVEAYDTIIFFERWYLVKTRLPVDKSYLKVATWLADEVETGTLSSLRTVAAKTYIQESYSLYITFSGEAT